MEHPFIADADGPRLAGVHPGNDEDLVFYLLLYLDQAVDVIEDGPFIVGRTRADDEQKAVVLSRQDIFDGFIPFSFDGLGLVVDGKLFHQFLRFRQFPNIFHLHFHSLPPCVKFVMSPL